MADTFEKDSEGNTFLIVRCISWSPCTAAFTAASAATWYCWFYGVFFNSVIFCLFQLSSKRRATVRGFKGKQYLDLREFYDKDGELKPGKKGLMLPLEQVRKLFDCAPALLEELEKDTK